MRWIDALVECTDTTATATACFSETDFPMAGGRLLEGALVECIAQTVAAALRHRAQSRGNPHDDSGDGMLVAVANFKIFSRPESGKTLRIEVREIKRLGPMLLVAGTVFCDGQAAAAGELSLYA